MEKDSGADGRNAPDRHSTREEEEENKRVITDVNSMIQQAFHVYGCKQE